MKPDSNAEPDPVSLARSSVSDAVSLSGAAAHVQYATPTSVGRYAGRVALAMAEIAANPGRPMVNHLRSAVALPEQGTRCTAHRYAARMQQADR